MSKFQKFQFDNFILDDDNQPYTEDWENQHIEVEAEENTPSAEELNVPEENVEPAEPEKEEPEVIEEESTPEPEVIEEIITYTEEEVAEKENQARTDGYTQGYAQAKKEQEEERNRLLAEINNKLSTFFADKMTQEQSAENGVIELARSVIKKVVPVLENEQAAELVKDFLRKNFASFKNESKLSFYFNPEMIKIAGEEISHLANSNDFEGKISLHKDEKMPLSDCKIEWENGGVERNGGKMLDKIDKIFDANTYKNE